MTGCFATIMLTALLFASRQTWRAWRAAQRERRRASDLQHTSATATARAAVLAERARLSADIESYVGELIDDDRPTGQGRARRRRPDDRHRLDPTPGPGGDQRVAPPARAAAGPRRDITVAAGPAATIPRLRISDVVVAGVIVGLAVTERVESMIVGEPASWLSVLLTIGTAATVLGRRTVPVLAAVAAATLMTIGAVTGDPVLDGFWFAATTAAAGVDAGGPGHRSVLARAGPAGGSRPDQSPAERRRQHAHQRRHPYGRGRHRRHRRTPSASAGRRGTPRPPNGPRNCGRRPRRPSTRNGARSRGSCTISSPTPSAWSRCRPVPPRCFGRPTGPPPGRRSGSSRPPPNRPWQNSIGYVPAGGSVQRTMTDVQELVERMTAAGLIGQPDRRRPNPTQR